MSKKGKIKNRKNINASNISEGERNSISLILTIFSVVIAAIAVFFTYEQNSLARKHNRLSVSPFINSYFSDSGDDELFGVYTTNNGLGTALITDLQVFVDGEEVLLGEPQLRFQTAIKLLGLNSNCYVVMAPRPGDTISINKEYAFIKIKNRSFECSIGSAYLHHMGGRLDYILYYESLYGEKFKYTYLKNNQIKVE